MTCAKVWRCGVAVLCACVSAMAAGAQQQPTLAELNSEFARLYRAGQYEQATEVVRKALAVAEQTLGPDHLGVAAILHDLANTYERQGQYAQAESGFRRSLAIQEKVLGPDHPDVIANLSDLAGLFHSQGKYSEAEPLFRRVLAIREKVLGPDHVDVAGSLNNLAGLWDSQGKYSQAEPLYQRALAIREKALGPEHPSVANSLNNLAVLYSATGRYVQAEPLYQRALAIREKALGPNHPDVAMSLNNLAALHNAQGQYVQVEPLIKRALAIREKALGPDHPEVSKALNHLAGLYCTQGQYAQAEPLFKRALAIREKALSPDHPEVSEALNNLAGLYYTQGQYAQAEPFFKRALAIREKALGPDHPGVSEVLNNLAGLHFTQGQYAQAEPLLNRALVIAEKTLGPDHPGVANALNNLAAVYLKQDQWARAEPLFRRALAINEKVLGPDHPNVAMGLNNLSYLYYSQGEHAQVEALCQRALAIVERAYGPDHPDVANAMNSLAAVYFTQGQYAQAETLSRRALVILEKSLGSDHGDVAVHLTNFAILKSAMDQDRDALTLCLRANAIVDRLITQVFSFSSEKERFQFLRTLDDGRSTFLTLCGERLRNDGVEPGLSFLLRRKGIVLDSLMEDAETARLSGDPALTALVTQLRETKTRLASLALAGPGKEGAEKYQATMLQVQASAEECEKELARQSVRFRALRPERQVTVSDVAAALPSGSALVEFAKYKSRNFSAKGKKPAWGNEKYVAYVLRHGESKPVLIKLGEADSIERLIKNYQAAMQGVAQQRAAIAEVNVASEALAAAVWVPVKAALGTAKRVYLSPDGELNFVSFAGLRDKTGRYLLEDYDLAYVASGRDLVRGKLAGDKTPKGSVLFGAPDFGDKAVEAKGEKATRAGNVRSDLVAVRAFTSLQFGPLPGTKTEVKGIKKLASSHGLKSETYLGRDASEGQVKATEQPRILHLATHGFFLPESGWNTPAGADDPMARGMKMMGIREDHVDLGKWKLENPMHRSGLALAGANLALAGKADAGKEDGILTAEEVAGLDLAGTELVVLSACETGLGEAKGGEGVLGLRRAFVQAGAQNLVMALWSVADDATQELMKAMYAKYLGGQPAWKALLDAQRDALAKERQAGREPNPYLWAAFVASGVGVE